MDAFATIDDLEKLTGRTFESGQTAQVEGLLESASTYLRSVVGQQVYPQATVEYTDWPTAGRLDLPQFPVVEVVSVMRDGVAVDYTYRPGYITVSCDDPVDVTYTFGYATAPDRLRDMACVLVSSALLTIEAELGLTAGGISSVAIDDFRLAFADGGAQSGMTLPKVTEDALRAEFGRGGFTLVETGR